jgi:hypothetical protein
LAAGRAEVADDGGLEVVGWTTAPEGLVAVVAETEVGEGVPLLLLLLLLKVGMLLGGGGAGAARWPQPPAVCCCSWCSS